MDQMKVFGYGGASAPRTPNIDAIAGTGVGTPRMAVVAQSPRNSQ